MDSLMAQLQFSSLLSRRMENERCNHNFLWEFERLK